MISNYIIYLNTLSNIEKNKYILYMTIFFVTILLISKIIYSIVLNHNNRIKPM